MVGDAALVAALLLVTTSRVISDQYMIWLIGMAACALAFPRTSQRPVALLLLITAGLTQLELRFLLKDVGDAGALGDIGVAILVLRDALLLAVAYLGFARLWRSTCRRQHIPRGWRQQQIPSESNDLAEMLASPSLDTA